MSGKVLQTITMVVFASLLLAACGPGNTLKTGGRSDNFRLTAVESSLEKAQDDLKEVRERQARDAAALAALHKQYEALVASLRAQGLRAAPAGAAAQSSALGVGFTHPGVAAASEAPPAPPVQASPAAPPAPPAGTAPADMPAGRPISEAAPPSLHGIPMPTPVSGRKPAVSSRQGSRGLGRVGPATPSQTPEAAIAADRAGQTPAPQPAAPAPGEPAPAAPAAGATPVSGVPAPTPPAAGTPAKASGQATGPDGPAASASPAEKEEYNRALQLAINGNAKGAQAAFERFATIHPTSPLAPSALYWVGESAYAAGDYKAAVDEFDKVAKGWPGHGKAADALYKMAMAQEKQGDVAAARATLERYLANYPQAELASVVRQKLQSLPK